MQTKKNQNTKKTATKKRHKRADKKIKTQKKWQQRKGTNVQTDQKYFQSRTAGFSPVTVAHLEAVWFSRWIYLDSSSHIQRHALHTYRCTHANKGTKFWGCTQTHKHIHTHTKTRTHAHTYIWIHLHINTYKHIQRQACKQRHRVLGA